jgi:hypothetical protein
MLAYLSISYGAVQAIFKQSFAIRATSITIDIFRFNFFIVYFRQGVGDGNPSIVVIALGRLVDNALTANFKTISLGGFLHMDTIY